MHEMISQAREMQEQFQQKMSEVVVEGNAGAGAVIVQMNGNKQLLRVQITPNATLGLGANSPDVEMLQDLVAAAFNDAARKVDEAVKGKVGGMLGNLGIPDLS
jgi:hypothetical protein